jgi:23S rRNA pseudouridine1911/1915/1917 synthase
MIKVLYEDNHLLLVEKPSNLLSQPSGTELSSAEEMAKTYLKDKYQKQGNVYLHAVHRLDKPVSGILLFAKTSKALSRLQAEMRERKMKKTYIAEVEGIIPKDEMTLEHYLVHKEKEAEVSDQPIPDGKIAKLKLKVLERKEKTTLVQITLETGRYHQIRAQLGYIGHPVVGDTKYGSKITSPRVHLHHQSLEFSHPVTKELLQITSPILF